MAKLPRATQKIFSSSTQADVTAWGSINTNPTTDPDLLQGAGYLTGITAGEVSGKALIPEKDLAGLFNVLSRQLAYIYEAGIPEYDAATTYYIGSVAREAATTNIYTSATDDNQGNALTDIVNWTPAGDFNNLSGRVGDIIIRANNIVPIGFLECDGSALSRTTYARLFADIGETYGIGDGSTTFNIPDLRGEFIRGWDNNRGVDVGRAIATSQADELKAHTHTSSFASGTGGSTYPQSVAAFNTQAYTYPNVNSAGGVETRPRNIAMMYCIKY